MYLLVRRPFILAALIMTVTSASGAPMERIGVVKAEGLAAFYGKSTGHLVVPRGANYTRLGSVTGSGDQYHLTFDPGNYDGNRAELALSAMQISGYNYVRVFLSSTFANQGFNRSVPGVDPVWLENVSDFLRRAIKHNIRVVLTGEWLPANYSSIAYAHGNLPHVTGVNSRLLSLDYAQATGQFWRDVLVGLKSLSPSLLSGIFSVDILNEGFVDLASERICRPGQRTIFPWPRESDSGKRRL
jgi:hypothetical protein